MSSTPTKSVCGQPLTFPITPGATPPRESWRAKQPKITHSLTATPTAELAERATFGGVPMEIHERIVRSAAWDTVTVLTAVNTSSRHIAFKLLFKALQSSKYPFSLGLTFSLTGMAIVRSYSSVFALHMLLHQSAWSLPQKIVLERRNDWSSAEIRRVADCLRSFYVRYNRKLHADRPADAHRCPSPALSIYVPTTAYTTSLLKAVVTAAACGSPVLSLDTTLHPDYADILIPVMKPDDLDTVYPLLRTVKLTGDADLYHPRSRGFIWSITHQPTITTLQIAACDLSVSAWISLLRNMDLPALRALTVEGSFPMHEFISMAHKHTQLGSVRFLQGFRWAPTRVALFGLHLPSPITHIGGSEVILSELFLKAGVGDVRHVMLDPSYPLSPSSNVAEDPDAPWKTWDNNALQRIVRTLKESDQIETLSLLVRARDRALEQLLSVVQHDPGLLRVKNLQVVVYDPISGLSSYDDQYQALGRLVTAISTTTQVTWAGDIVATPAFDELDSQISNRLHYMSVKTWLHLWRLM